MRTLLSILLLAALIAPAVADTLHMNNGTQITGKVVFQTDDRVELQIGDRKVVIRKNEIRTIEQNDKTGELNAEEIRERVQERLAAIEDETGLTVDDIRAIKELVQKLRSRDALEQEDAFLALKEMQKRADVLTYLQQKLSRYTAGFAVPVMEVIYKLDAEAGLESARASVEVLSPAIRGKALAILARSANDGDFAYVVRGLVDPDSRVRVIATKAMGERGEKRATPAILPNLQSPNPYLRGASRDVLQALWQVPQDEVAKMNEAAWESLWEERQAEVANAYRVSQLTPLVNPHEQFVRE